MVKTKRLNPVTILYPNVAGVVVDVPAVAANVVKWLVVQAKVPVARPAVDEVHRIPEVDQALRVEFQNWAPVVLVPVYGILRVILSVTKPAVTARATAPA